MARQQRRMERILKGAANHRRLEIMGLLTRQPDLALREISRALRIDYRTASEHTRKLSLGGLVWKRYEGRLVRHRVSDRGRRLLTFCETLQ